MEAKKCVPLGREEARRTISAEVKATAPVATVGRGREGCTACGRVEALSRALAAAQEEAVPVAALRPTAQAEASPAAAEAPTQSTSSISWEAEPEVQPQLPAELSEAERAALRGELAPVHYGAEAQPGAQSQLEAQSQPEAQVKPQTQAQPQPVAEDELTATPQILTREETALHLVDDFPTQMDSPWLGSGNESFAPLLQEMIRKELTDWHYYRSLGKRSGGATARTFTALAAEEWQCAKRLSAAYFLSSGIRYWPERTDRISLPSYLTALRERFHAEQQDAERYSASAEACNDECLREIFEEIAALNRRHAQQIRLLVEQL